MKTSRQIIDKEFFNGNREIAIKRDGYKCVKCGMSRKEHKRKYKRDLTVDHIDGRGKYTPKELRNNNLENLQTLCLHCHGIKDIYRSPNTKPKRVAQIDTNGKIIRIFESAMDAQRNGFDNNCINKAARDIYSNHRGYFWKFI